MPTDFSVIYQKPARDVVFAVSLNRSGFKAVAKGPMGVSIQEWDFPPGFNPTFNHKSRGDQVGKFSRRFLYIVYQHSLEERQLAAQALK